MKIYVIIFQQQTCSSSDLTLYNQPLSFEAIHLRYIELTPIKIKVFLFQ